MARTLTIDGVELMLAHEDELDLEWIGDRDAVDQLLAAWMVVDQRDIPMNPRLLGKPGVGKTTLAYSVARKLGRPVYIVQCTTDTRPEDLIVSPVLDVGGRIRYHASGLVTAMLTGGVCILDEGNRMMEKSWASLAPLLDQRRYVESVVAGIKLKAAADFRICVTMNEDASTYDVPEYISSRLKPVIELEFPSRDEEIAILRYALPFAPEQLLVYVADFLQKAHGRNLPFTSRDGVHVARYALKLAQARGGAAPEGFLSEAIEGVLGTEGIEFMDSGDASDRMAGAMRELSDDEKSLLEMLEGGSEFELDELGEEEDDDDDPVF